MKKVLTAIASGLFLAAGAAEPGILFSTSFDKGTLAADFAAGKAAPVQNENIKISTLGKGNGGAGHFAGEKEILAYESAKNMDFRNGAFSCKLIPDWNALAPENAKIFAVIFQAGNGWCHNDPDILSLVYDAARRRLCFIVTGKKNAGKLQMGQCLSPDGSVVFEKGKPCVITAAWKNLNTPGNTAELEIFWNGKRVAKQSFPSFAFMPNTKFTLGNYAGRRYNHQLRAVFDWVKISHGTVSSGTPAAKPLSTAAVEPGTLFSASFDKGTLAADFAAGKAAPVQNENIKISTLGKGNGGAGHFAGEKEILAYESAGNVDFRNGAFSCKLVPDWNALEPENAKIFAIIFQAGNGWCHNDQDILSLVYDAARRRLCFIVTGKKNAGKLQLEQCASPEGSVIFEKGKPCVITAAWKNLNTPGTKAELEIFWNGKRIAKRSFPSFAFTPNARFTLGNYAGRQYNHQVRAVFDWVKIFKGNPFFGNAAAFGGEPAACFFAARTFRGTAAERTRFIGRETHRIDGNLDDWKEPVFFLTERKFPVRAAFSWDEQFLYCAVEVQDAEHCQNNPDMRLWEQDSLQIALDVFNEKKSGSYGKHDFEFCIALKNGRVRVVPNVTPVLEEVGQLAIDPAQVRAAVVHSGGKTVYECAFPWRTTLLRKAAPQAGEAIGVNFLVNNAGRATPRSYVEWSKGIGSSKDPAAFHTLVMYDGNGPAAYAEHIRCTDSLLSLNAAAYNPTAGPVKNYSLAYTLSGLLNTVQKMELPPQGGIEYSLQIPLEKLPYGKLDFLFSICSGDLNLVRRTHQQVRVPAQELVRRLNEAENAVRAKMNRIPADPVQNNAGPSWRSIVKTIAEFRLGWLEQEKRRTGGKLPISFFQDNIRDLHIIADELDAAAKAPESPRLPKTDLKQLKIAGGNFLQNGAPIFLIGPNFDEKGSLASIRRSLDFVPRMGFNLVDLSDTLSVGWMGPDGRMDAKRLAGRFEVYRAIAAEKKLALGMNPALHYVSNHFYKNTSLCGGQALPDGKVWGAGNYPSFRERCGGHFMPFDLSAPATEKLFDSFYDSFLDQWRALDTFHFLWLTNEMDYFSKSPAFFAGFRSSLQRKYGDIAKLNRAWHTGYASFEAIGQQSPGDPGYFDFMLFHRAEVTGLLTHLAEKVRGKDRALLLSNKPQAFTLLDPGKGMDFEAQAKLLDIPGFDSGFASDAYRMNVDFNGMMAMDFLRSVAPQKPLANLEFHYNPENQNAALQQTVHMQSFLHGVRMDTFWLWVERCRSRDHEGMFLTSGEKMLTAARIYFRLQKLAGSIAKFPAPRQVVLYYGDASLFKQPGYAESLKRCYQALLGMQLSIGFVTDKMLAEDCGTDCGVIIVPNAQYIRPESLDKLAKLAETKKVLLLGDCFRFDPYGAALPRKPFATASRCKLPNGDYPEYRKVLAGFLKNAGLVRPVEVEIIAGKNLNGVDSQSVRDGSGVLCFLINMNNNPVTVRLSSKQGFNTCTDLLPQTPERLNPAGITIGAGTTRLLRLR